MAESVLKDGKRKLAVVMFTDIVGYTAISHRDEALALELLDEHRQIARPIFAEFRGREIKTIGDAFLMEFESALDAVNCAIRLHEAFVERNARSPRVRRIKVRVGLHLDEIVVSENDVYGDGVNIAARLQALAKPETICISNAVREQVEGKTSRPIIAKGRRKLKNIQKPMPYFLIDCRSPVRERDWPHRLRRSWKKAALNFAAGIAASALIFAVGRAAFPSRSLSMPEPERLAVLPFTNISEAADEYLSDGMTEELISNLSKLPQLRVLSRGSMARYKGTAKPPSEIGKELKVNSLISGSVRRHDKQIRISVHLIDPRKDETIWSKDFDGRVEDVFEIQKRIAQQISQQFKSRTVANNPSPASAPQSDAYLAYLRGRYAMNQRSQEGLQKGMQYFLEAIRLDPKFAQAYSSVANAAGLQSYYGGMPPKEAMKLVRTYTEQAMALDPESAADGLLSLAEAQSNYDFDWKGAEETFRQVLQLKPGGVTAHQWYAEFLVFRGRFEEASQELQVAMQLDPLSLVVKTAVGVQQYYRRDYESAIRLHRLTMDMDPSFMLAHFWGGLAYVQTHRYKEAVTELEKASELTRSAPMPMVRAALAYAYGISGDRARAREVLQELLTLATSRYVSAYEIAMVYVGLDEREKGLTWLEKAIEERSGRVASLRVDPVFDPWRQDPRFISVLKHLDD